jgi:hypothetical protein
MMVKYISSAMSSGIKIMNGFTAMEVMSLLRTRQTIQGIFSLVSFLEENKLEVVHPA